jgi:hypothetical protein
VRKFYTTIVHDKNLKCLQCHGSSPRYLRLRSGRIEFKPMQAKNVHNGHIPAGKSRAWLYVPVIQQEA